MNVMEHTAQLGREIVIHPHKFLPPVGRLRNRGVETSTDGRRTCVRSSRVIGGIYLSKECLPVRVDRHHVVGEGLERRDQRVAGIRRRRWAVRKKGRWVVPENHVRIAPEKSRTCRGANIRKVPPALCVRRNWKIKCIWDTLEPPLFRPEKKRFALVGVVVPSDINRAA